MPEATAPRTTASASNWRRGVVGLWLVLTALPPLVLLLVSLASGWFWPRLFPQAWTLRGWSYALSPAADLWPALGNSVLLAVGCTGLCLAVGLPAGRALGLHVFPGREVVRFCLLLPLMVPPIAYVMGVHWAMLRVGLADTRAGLVLAHAVPALPYMVMSLASQFANLDVRMEEQARSLGARPWQVAWRVTLPAIRPGIVLGCLLAALVSWSQYLLSLLIGGGAVPTLPLLVFAAASGSDAQLMATMTLIFVAPPLAALLLMTWRRLPAEATP